MFSAIPQREFHVDTMATRKGTTLPSRSAMKSSHRFTEASQEYRVAISCTGPFDPLQEVRMLGIGRHPLHLEGELVTVRLRPDRVGDVEVGLGRLERVRDGDGGLLGDEVGQPGVGDADDGDAGRHGLGDR